MFDQWIDAHQEAIFKMMTDNSTEAISLADAETNCITYASRAGQPHLFEPEPVNPALPPPGLISRPRSIKATIIDFEHAGFICETLDKCIASGPHLPQCVQCRSAHVCHLRFWQ